MGNYFIEGDFIILRLQLWWRELSLRITMIRNRKPVRPKRFKWVTVCDIPGFTWILSISSSSVQQIVALRLFQNPSISLEILRVGQRQGRRLLVEDSIFLGLSLCVLP